MNIYLHLPFCHTICTYCDFPKVLYDKKITNQYLEQLEKEIKKRYKNEKVKTIYIGGGTPTCLTNEELKKLLEITKIFNKEKQIEFTVESNIESLNQEKISILKEYKVNRISLGVQSFDDKIIKYLNRHHNQQMIEDVVKLLKKNNISNISIDYIYGITEDENLVKEDIKKILKLNIPHISCYSLIIEDGTILKINGKKYINEDIEKRMYDYIKQELEKNKYHQYEISNYSKEGYESIHNLNYWNNGEYYGFGLGAVSYVKYKRRTNTRNLSKYLKGTFKEKEIYENKQTRISNALILGLRKIKGISIIDFNKKYKCLIQDQENIKTLLEKQQLEIKDGYLKIPDKYIYVSNNILINLL